jgi:hypothetical protein
MAKFDPTIDEAYEFDIHSELPSCDCDMSLSKNGWNLKFLHARDGFESEVVLSSMYVEDWEALLEIAKEGLKRAKRSAKF